MANVPLFGHREPDSTSGVCVRQLHKPPKEWRDMCVRERERKKSVDVYAATTLPSRAATATCNIEIHGPKTISGCLRSPR
jgi:hypothetical protein